jgi:hypothetical protein
MLEIVGLIWRSLKDGIERRTPVKVSTRTGIGTCIMKDPSILPALERKIVHFLKLIKVVNST